jgi:phosphoribosylformylglycinamidine synthase I
MAAVRVLILRAAGTNCDRETQYAWELAGATVDRLHVRDLIARPAMLHGYQVLTIPGGFSYGDDIAAGRILAAQLGRNVRDEMLAFVDAGRLVLGICNGFQVLVRMGLLPFGIHAGPRSCTVTCNDPPGFQDRWVNLRAGVAHCAFLEAGREYEMPIAHGEGRVTFETPEVQAQVEQGGYGALRYVPARAETGIAPGALMNPNGSAVDLAGLCDASGRILGLMPHPERFVTWTQHPCWTALPAREEGDGLAVFRRALTYFR